MTDAADQPVLPPPEEPKMEIHKPKPVHSWREFLVELGTITLGVCIALAAEQTVEWFHWRDKTNYATDQIQRELAESMYFSVERIMVEGCVQHRLDDLEQKLLSGGEHRLRLPERSAFRQAMCWRCQGVSGATLPGQRPSPITA